MIHNLFIRKVAVVTVTVRMKSVQTIKPLHHFWVCSEQLRISSLSYSFKILTLCSCGWQGELATDHDVVDFIMNQPNVVPRINPRVLSTSRTYLDLSDTSEYTSGI